MPMILQDNEAGQNCSSQYNNAGEEVGRECRETENYTTTFAGMKAISIDTTEGITEAYSYDYMDLIKQDKDFYRTWNNQVNPRQFQQLQFRVGYLGDALYAINNLFAHFAVMGKDLEVTEIFDAKQLSENN